MLAENSQLLVRCPQPVSRSGSNVEPGMVVPKSRLAIWPQLSPPLAVRFCASGFARLQSTTKLRFESDQLRLVNVRMALAGFVVAAPNALSVCPSRYLFAATFSADLPLPNRSKTAPDRYVRSFQLVLSCAGKWMFRFSRPTNAGPGPIVCSGNDVLNQSYLIAPVTVARLSFQVSCANAPKSWFSSLRAVIGAANSVTKVGVPWLKV